MHNLTNNDSLIPCRDYLKTRNDSKLTIIHKVELPELKALFWRNFYFKSQFGSLPILIRKGFIPIMIRDGDTNLIIGDEEANSKYPDYFCLNNTGQLFNITEINFKLSNLIYKNVAINFLFGYQNETNLSNYTINHVYNLLGTFSFNVYTIFGQNLLTSSIMFINVQRIKTYPFKSIQINRFEINCTLKGLSLDCVLSINISNYANSFQQLIIDYGDDSSFDLINVNPYCNDSFYCLNLILINT